MLKVVLLRLNCSKLQRSTTFAPWEKKKFASRIQEKIRAQSAERARLVWSRGTLFAGTDAFLTVPTRPRGPVHHVFSGESGDSRNHTEGGDRAAPCGRKWEVPAEISRSPTIPLAHRSASPVTPINPLLYTYPNLFYLIPPTRFARKRNRSDNRWRAVA